jgi:outer membrane receptor protein involved in Fe transport
VPQRFLAACATVLICAAIAGAQINTGRITGSVLDPTGGAVPEVNIRAINEDTGVVTNTLSLSTGDYLVNFLVPGRYRVEVEKTGFQKAVQTGIVVNAGGIAHVDIRLQVGEVRQVVEVVANQTQVSTDTSELSQTFTHRELDALPNVDRNPLFQMNLMPGANNGRGSGNYGTNGGENGSAVGITRPQVASLGGVDANANTVMIEGTYNREPQNAYIGLAPPIEGIQEVQIYTGKYNAEYGFSGSAVVNVVTRSGTNEFHGSAFEYLRNDALNARGFFATRKTPFRRNQYGGSLGGPVKTNKLFFFADYQGSRISTSGQAFSSVPSDRMYNGDFSELYALRSTLDRAGAPYGQIYDPFTRKFDAQGKVTSATPFAGNIIPRSRWDPAAAKMNDAFLWGKANLTGIENNLLYLNRSAQDSHQADGRLDYNLSSADRFFFRYSTLKALLDNATDVNQFFQNGADSNTLNQNMQVTHHRTFGPSKMNELRLSYNRTNVQTSNKSMDKPWNNLFGIKNGNLGDSITQGLLEFDLAPLHGVGKPDWVAFIISNGISLTENFTLVKGRHNMKFGANLNWIEDTSADTIGGDDPRGRVSFSPAMTSYDGDAANFAYPSFLLGTPTSSARARFVNGWPYQTYWQNAWYAQDDLKLLPSLTLNLGLRYEITSRPVERYNRQANWDTRTNVLVVATKDNRSPAMQLDRKNWGPRLGLAWTPDHGKTSIRGGYGISYWQGYWNGPLTKLGLTYPSYVKQAFVSAGSLLPTVSFANDGIPVSAAVYDSQNKLLIPANALVNGVDYDWRSQRVDQYSVNLEREVRRGVVLDLGYLGVHGRNNNHVRDINLAPPGPANVDFNTRRPLHDKYPNLQDIPVTFSEAESFYDALTARVTGNVSRYLRVYLTYAHGRNFSNGNNIDPARISQFYGPTAQDIAHIFNAQVNFQLPVGKGRAALAGAPGWLDQVIGGWEYSGFLFMRSGTRFGVGSPVSLLNNGQGNRPDRIKDGNLPKSERTLQRWYDTAAFVNHLEPLTYGTAGTNPLFADGEQQLDSSFFKTFRLIERWRLQFRADLINTFNHPNFNPPSATVGSGSNGRVTSTSVESRQVQFGLRLFF